MVIHFQKNASLNGTRPRRHETKCFGDAREHAKGMDDDRRSKGFDMRRRRRGRSKREAGTPTKNINNARRRNSVAGAGTVGRLPQIEALSKWIRYLKTRQYRLMPSSSDRGYVYRRIRKAQLYILLLFRYDRAVSASLIKENRSIYCIDLGVIMTLSVITWLDGVSRLTPGTLL